MRIENGLISLAKLIAKRLRPNVRMSKAFIEARALALNARGEAGDTFRVDECFKLLRGIKDGKHTGCARAHEGRDRAEFDYDTIAEAKEHVGSMFDLDTREGQGLFEESMREARIRERDVDGNAAGTRTVIGSGSVTLRDSGGVECEVETTCGPKLLTFQTPIGLTGDSIEIMLVRESGEGKD